MFQELLSQVHSRADHGAVLRVVTSLLFALAPLAAQGKEYAALVTRGLAAHKAGKHAEAIAELTRAREISRDDPQLARVLAASHMQLATSAYAAHDLELASRQLVSADRLWPEQEKVLQSLALVRFDQGRMADARAFAERALAKNDKNAVALALLGQLAAERDERKEASVLMARAAAAAPEREQLKAHAKQLEREAGVEDGFRTLEVGPFKICHDPKNANAADALAFVQSALRAAHSELERELGGAPPPPIGVVLYTDAQYAAMNVHNPHAIAFFDGKLRIEISAWPKQKDALLANLRHELTHAFVYALFPDAPPWLHEGYAQTIEKRSVAAARARLRDPERLLTGSMFESGFARASDEDVLRRGYDQALLAVDLLRRDRIRFGALLDEFRRGKATSDDALGRVYGFGMAELRKKLIRA